MCASGARRWTRFRRRARRVIWSPCGLPQDELIAYADGDLDPQRHAEIETHLKSCAICQERVRSSEETGQLLRARYPPQDNPGARAEIMRQVRAIAAKSQAPPEKPRSGWRYRAQRWPVAIAASLTVMLVVAVGLPMTTEADFRLGRFVSFVNHPGESGLSNLPAGQEPPGTPVTLDNVSGTEPGDLSFQPVEPTSLPLNLQLVETVQVSDYRLTLVYTDGAGTIVEIHQEPVEQSNVTFPAAVRVMKTVYNTEVLIHRNQLGAHGRAVWERNGMIFDLLVRRWVGSGLSIQSVVDMVSALIEEQMAQESER